MSAAFDAWLRDTFARTKGFTALLVLVKRDHATIWPLGSSYAGDHHATTCDCARVIAT